MLAGVHGAGLANALLMEPGAGALLEVWLGMEDNFHYGAVILMLLYVYVYISLLSEVLAAGCWLLHAA